MNRRTLVGAAPNNPLLAAVLERANRKMAGCGWAVERSHRLKRGGSVADNCSA